MKQVILCNRPGPLKALLEDVAKPLRYIVLAETEDSRLIRSYLAQRPDAEELPKTQMVREHCRSYREKYVDFMGRLNQQNSSLTWWSLTFSDRNPSAPDLCRDTLHFLLIVELVHSTTEFLLVITDRVPLAAQVKVWGEREGIRVVNSVKQPWSLRRLIKQTTPGGIVYASARTFLHRLLSKRFKPGLQSDEGHLVIITPTHPSCFVSSDGYRDTYFGPLVEHIAASSFKALIGAVVLERPVEQLRKLRRLTFNLPVLPLESFLTLRDLMACTKRALGVYFRPAKLQGQTEIDGHDISCLLQAAYREERHSGNFFMNLRVYYCVKRLARDIQVARCVYPYENLAWEKSLLLGMRSVSPHTRMVGYQHASITLSHIDFLLGSDEADIMPLPDQVLTSGEVTREWLEKEGNYPEGIFKTACALRQGQPPGTGKKPRNQPLTKVLVALATSVDEYVNTLVFLEKAFASTNGYDLRIRPHPIIPLESALKVAPLIDHNFFSTNSGPLIDALQWADVVLYASSTVGLEAVAMGIPAVYLDLGSYLDTDPMFGWNELKWSVGDPSDLTSTLAKIEAIPTREFEELQSKAEKYSVDYLRPVTPDALRTFLEA